MIYYKKLEDFKDDKGDIKFSLDGQIVRDEAADFLRILNEKSPTLFMLSQQDYLIFLNMLMTIIKLYFIIMVYTFLIVIMKILK